jgi:epoxyqueuosine reductase
MKSGNDSGLAKRIVVEARHLGFDLAAITPAGSLATARHYRSWVARGYHGQMAYLARPDSVARRQHLERSLPGVRSVVTVAANYHTVPALPALCGDPSRGIIASYARGLDYHDVLAPRLEQLGRFVAGETSQELAFRAYVDTGPLLERELAARAGLGFVGKNTNLIHPRLGSWLFLGELLLSADIPVPVSGHRTGQAGSGATDPGPAGAGCPGPDLSSLLVGGTCGGCTRCLDACPTNAFVAPYLLDARRCIAYLTIELKGPIPTELRTYLGNRIFGCDICQEVCPWNRRFAQPSSDPAFQPRTDSIVPHLLDLITLDEESFRRRFRGTPIYRTKRRGLLRNVAVALGNWGDALAVPALARALGDREPLIRGHAAWALGQIATDAARRALAQAMDAEKDEWVRSELAQAR